MSRSSIQESRLFWLLNSIALIMAALTIVGLIGAYNGPSTTGVASAFFIQAPFVSNATAGLGLLALIAWFASADLRRGRPLTYTLIAGLAFGAVATIALSFSLAAAAIPAFIWAVAVVIPALLAVVLLLLQRDAERHHTIPIWQPWMTDKPITGWEKVARVIAVVVGAASLAGAIASVIIPFTGPSELADFFTTPLMVGLNSIKLVLLAILLFIAAANIRRYPEMLTLFVLGNVVSLLSVIITNLGIARFGTTSVSLAGMTLSTRDIMLNALVLDGVVVVGFTVLKALINRDLLNFLTFFSPLEFRALEAIAEGIIDGGASAKVPPYQVALRTDSYLGAFRSNRLWLSRMAILALQFMPLLVLKPPINFLNPIMRREFIDRYFKRNIIKPRGLYWILTHVAPRRILDLIEAAMRFNMQLTYLGYYSDARVQREIGYVPFSQRTVLAPPKVIRRYPPLRVIQPDDLDKQGVDMISSADVVIIGSGAGGSILAEQMACQGREVLLLERGKYTNPDDFNEDEVGQIGKLYSDGALQLSQALRFTVLQGSGVGGSTVINNAVCFDTPDRVLDRWNDPNGTDAGIDVAQYRAAQAAVRARLSIQSIKDSSKSIDWQSVLNPGDSALERGIRSCLTPGTYEYDVVSANISDCLGCGYCNIGCKFGRKLSMLDEVLPKAQLDRGADQFRILSEAEAIGLRGDAGHIKEITVRLGGRRELLIRNPKTVIVSAGTVASSWLLMRSGIGKGELPVGRHLSFNMGSPLHARFEKKLDSYAGLQIAHYLKLNDHPGFVYETWYNPPVSQAMSMPGWLDTHYRNMQQYDHIHGVGVLVGTESNASISPALFLRGAPDIVYDPTERDLDSLVTALIMLGKIFFAAGAKEVFASTRRYASYEAKRSITYTAEELDNLRSLVRDDRDILLGTGHPQGGNAISKKRGRDGANGGVIGPDFKVYGYDNLHVCDASVFPTSTTVNPQLSVMTMAQYAAGRIR